MPMHSWKLIAVSVAVTLALVVQASAQSVAPETAGRSETLPSTIPIFPLEVTMIFPGVSRPLHIFEARYRAMVADALKGDRIIGMATLKPGFESNYGGRPPIYEVGCAGVITDVQELSNGRYNIVIRGVAKFRVIGEDNSRLYRLAHIQTISEALDDAQRTELRTARQRLEALITKGSTSKVPDGMADAELVNWVAQYAPVDYAKKQELLELDNAVARARALIQLIESGVIRAR